MLPLLRVLVESAVLFMRRQGPRYFHVLQSLLQYGSEKTTSWFSKNGVSTNITKFKALFLNSNMISDEIQLSVNAYDVPIVSSAKLLGVTFDDKLNFNEHVEILCRKASLQINAIVRLAKFLDKRTLRILYNLYYNSVRTSVCLCVCVCVLELLLDRSTDSLHFW